MIIQIDELKLRQIHRKNGGRPPFFVWEETFGIRRDKYQVQSHGLGQTADESRF